MKKLVPDLKYCKKFKKLWLFNDCEFWLFDTRKSWKDYNKNNGKFIPFSDDYEIEIGEKNEKLNEGYNNSTPVPAPMAGEMIREINKMRYIRINNGEEQEVFYECEVLIDKEDYKVRICEYDDENDFLVDENFFIDERLENALARALIELNK